MKPRYKLYCLRLFTLSLLGSLAATPVYAFEFGASMLYGYESSDNIDQVEKNGGIDPREGDNYEVVGRLGASTRSLNLDMDMDFSLGATKGSGINGDTAIEATGGLYTLFNIRPGQVSWLLADYLVQQGDDLSALNNSDERSLANFFVTGPATHWRMSPVDSVDLSLFYMLSDSEGDPEQTRQLSFRSDLTHRFSRVHSLGIHFEDSDVSFKQNDDEFGIVNTYGRYIYTQNRGQVVFDMGASNSTQKQADNTGVVTDEKLLRVDWNRQISRELSFLFSGSQVFSNETTRALRDLQEGLNAGLNIGTGSFYEKRVALGLAQDGAIWSAGLNASTTDFEFADVDSQIDDRKVLSVEWNAAYSLSSVWRLHTSATKANIKYDNLARKDSELTYGLGATYQFTSAWALSLDAFHNRTKEDISVEENTLNFNVSWQPLGKLSRLREKYKTKQIENVLQ